MPVVLDHFGWPEDLSDSGRRAHLALLRRVADEPNVATRIDAIGTIFRDWETGTLRPWLHGVVEVFGPERCMLGSDLPIETLRSSFTDLYAAYDTIFDSYLRRRPAVAVRQHGPAPLRRRQYSPLMTKKEPRMVPASFDFCVANLNRDASSSGTGMPSESLNPTARFDPGSRPYMTLIERPDA